MERQLQHQVLEPHGSSDFSPTPCILFAAVGGCHKFRGLRLLRFILLKLWMSTSVPPGSDQGWQTCIPSGGSRGDALPGLLPFPEAPCIPWLMASSSVIEPVPTSIIRSLFFLGSALLPPSYQDPCGSIEPTWITQANLSISKS